jgi:hypothetical protein
MERIELIKKVALKMDEISSSNQVVVDVLDSDNNPLYALIDGLLNESINDVLTKAPVYRLQSSFMDMGNTEEIALLGGRMAVRFLVPSNFIRIASITDDSNFRRPIVDLAIEGDDVDKRQHNQFLVAKGAKPVAVIGRNSDGERIITCYSYNADSAPQLECRYIQRFDGGPNDDIDLDDYMTELVSWVCAGRVFAVQGDLTRGKICDDNAAALMI